MTMPHERTRSLVQTEQFLQELSKDPNLSELLRRQAKVLLRHYPSRQDIALKIKLDERCREELAVLADKHGPLHPVLVFWLVSEPMFGDEI